MQLVHEQLRQSCERSPDSAAIISDGETLTYGRLWLKVELLAGLLVELGVERGDRVVILLRDKPTNIVACYAVIRCGAIAVPLADGSSERSVVAAVQDSGCVVMISSSEDLLSFPHIRDDIRSTVITIERWTQSSGQPPSYRILGRAGKTLWKHRTLPDALRSQPDDGAFILYTSGTSGDKKGVLLTHRNLFHATCNINAFTQIGSDLRECVLAPLAHSFGLGRVRCILAVGGTVMFPRRPSLPSTIIHAILDEHCNAFSAVPSALEPLFGTFEPMLHAVGRRVRFIELGSAPMPVDRKSRLIDLFPNARICMHYGLTEASRSTFLDLTAESSRLDTVGRPVPGVEISIDHQVLLDESDKSGEILIRGKHVTTSYWNNPHLTRERLTTDGWFRTGDFGYMDADGYLHLLGKDSDMINMDGIKISPFEVEMRMLEAFPGVDMCVLGLPDPSGIHGEVPALCYVSSHNIHLTPADVFQKLISKLDRFKIPRLVYGLKAMPRTSNGKISRSDVRVMLSGGRHLEAVHA